MTLPLTTDTLRHCYEFLDSTPPFNKWNLPDSPDVKFKVIRDPALRGWYRKENGKHTIGVSSSCVGHTLSLMIVMAHEMIHVFEEHSNACGAGEHSAAFHRYDPKLF